MATGAVGLFRYRAGSARVSTQSTKRSIVAGRTGLLFVLALVAPARAQTAIGAQDALHPGGIQAAHILQLWHGTVALCLAVFILVLGACLLALWRAPRGSRQSPADLGTLDYTPGTRERRLLRAVGWGAALSSAGLIVLFAGDILAGRALAQLPVANALHIELTGHSWWWEARYRDPVSNTSFTTANELHLPVGRAAIITLRSDDVIHSLWVPNLHGKLDLIPGRTTEIRVRADRAGVYRGQCAEFCGLQHTMMALQVVAEPVAVYAGWAEGQQRPAAAAPANHIEAQRGAQVFLDNQCAGCHAIRGTAARAGIGPDLTHLASRQTIAAGMLPNARGHLAGWIVDAPSIKPGVRMPAIKLAPDDLQALLTYLETLH
jgi:cytochrome c oxidase subunit 2